VSCAALSGSSQAWRPRTGCRPRPEPHTHLECRSPREVVEDRPCLRRADAPRRHRSPDAPLGRPGFLRVQPRGTMPSADERENEPSAVLEFVELAGVPVRSPVAQRRSNHAGVWLTWTFASWPTSSQQVAPDAGAVAWAGPAGVPIRCTAGAFTAFSCRACGSRKDDVRGAQTRVPTHTDLGRGGRRGHLGRPRPVQCGEVRDHGVSGAATSLSTGTTLSVTQR
jgi:hypothetical protein